MNYLEEAVSAADSGQEASFALRNRRGRRSGRSFRRKNARDSYLANEEPDADANRQRVSLALGLGIACWITTIWPGIPVVCKYQHTGLVCLYHENKSHTHSVLNPSSLSNEISAGCA